MHRVLLVLVALASPAGADSVSDSVSGSGGSSGSRRTPSITVNAGAVLPLFLPYELPGPWVGASAAWSMSERAQLVASADTGLLVAAGSTRLLGSLGGGVRISPGWRVWAQLGVGVTGYVERIGVVLPDRDVRATDRGVALTGDITAGFRLTPRWEICVSYDHRVVSTGPDRMYTGEETLPFVGTGMISIGRKL